ncbi:NAD(P)/FAD-dependent oxidoreductase [Micromonospora sp. CPCC 205711]|uniref:NAD(P)/FAD-dependent oxidoreductase n=1 Tax=Micromonospora sp. CPCC 205547 TaxID=3122400 RepID=UPI002FF39D69
MAQPHTVIIGAGPAGLTAAYELTRRRASVDVVEADDVVGGISRTVERDGWRFDIGGHRFFTKVPRVAAFWHEVLPPADFPLRPRMSRIHYRGRLFDYPLRAGNALANLGPVEAVRCVGSYLWARVRPPADQSHFEGWVSARFGARLYRMFFKTYTEKVWGLPATALRADWAAQRIRNLSLGAAVRDALRPGRGGTDVTSLIEEFRYPRLGPGMMWERCAELVTTAGGTVTVDTTVRAVHRDEGRAVAVTVVGADGERRIAADHVVSSMPLPALVRAMDPPAPAAVRAAADALRHRDFLTVALVVPTEAGFPDNWIYVHTPGVRVGRIQNFGAWSPEMVRDGGTCLGLEYFVTEGDALWTAADDELVALGTTELGRLGLVRAGTVTAGYVVRMPKAYPVYDQGYAEAVDTIRRWLAVAAPNVHPVGRNGMHRYNNQDHSMLTAMLTAENILDDAGHDVWTVNVDDDYHEGGGTGRAAPVFPR